MLKLNYILISFQIKMQNHHAGLEMRFFKTSPSLFSSHHIEGIKNWELEMEKRRGRDALLERWVLSL